MRIDTEQIKEIYKKKSGDYYINQMNPGGLRSLWFRQRQLMTRVLIKKYAKQDLILDLGCGNCLWNDNGAHTVGIDICEAMLRCNQERINYFFSLKADIMRGLPIKSNSIDTVIITEILEHTKNYSFMIEEISRVLKSCGVVIVSVPYGKLPGLWGLIFPLWCSFKGLLEKDEYYLNKCGHVSSFNATDLRRAFNKFIFLEQVNISYLTLFSVFRKI